MAELKARQADVEAQLSTLHGRDPRNLPLSAEMRLMVESDPVLRYYRQQVEQADISIAAAQRSVMGPNHRIMQYMADQRDGYFQKEAARARS